MDQSLDSKEAVTQESGWAKNRSWRSAVFAANENRFVRNKAHKLGRTCEKNPTCAAGRLGIPAVSDLECAVIFAGELRPLGAYEYQEDTTHERQTSKNGREWDCLFRFRSRFDRTDVDNFFALGVGNALIGKGEDSEDDEQDADHERNVAVRHKLFRLLRINQLLLSMSRFFHPRANAAADIDAIPAAAFELSSINDRPRLDLFFSRLVFPAGDPLVFAILLEFVHLALGVDLISRAGGECSRGGSA